MDEPHASTAARRRFSSATSSAGPETSVATTWASAARPRSQARSHRSRADVEDGRSLDAPKEIEAALDDALRLRPRDQDAGIHHQRQPPEAPLAEDVRERLARGAPRNERPVAVELGGRELTSGAVQLTPAQPEDVGEQPLGVHLRRGRLGPLERGRALGESLSNRHTAAASSARRRSSSLSAPVNSSSSPPSTASSRCAVSLTR